MGDDPELTDVNILSYFFRALTNKTNKILLYVVFKYYIK